MDKPGAGESQGECAKADSESEITGWPAAFNAKAKYDFTDLDRVFVVGLCNRSGFSAIPRSPSARFHLLSLLGRTWYGHKLELERRRLRGARKSPAEVNTAVKAFADFYDLYPDEWDDSRAGCRSATGVDEPLVRTPRRGATVVRLSFISSTGVEPRRSLAEREGAGVSHSRERRLCEEASGRRIHCADRQPDPSGNARSL
jgi:hypothetical protein